MSPCKTCTHCFVPQFACNRWRAKNGGGYYQDKSTPCTHGQGGALIISWIFLNAKDTFTEVLLELGLTANYISERMSLGMNREGVSGKWIREKVKLIGGKEIARIFLFMAKVLEDLSFIY